MKTLLLSSLLLLAIAAQAHGRCRRNSDISSVLARAVRYHPAIKAAAIRYSVDPRLLWTIGYLETRFEPRCVSPKGARGMMQFIPATGRRYGLFTRRDLHDPIRSIDAAARYVRDLNAMFGGKIDLVLAGYNAGEYAVINSRYKVPPYRETRRYVALGLSVFKRIADGDLFSLHLLPSVAALKETSHSPHVALRRPASFPRKQPARSIYFPL